MKKPKIIANNIFGAAFDLNNGKILKFTKDRGEVANAHKLKFLNLKHFVNYYDILNLKFKNNKNIYVLTLDKVNIIEKEIIINDLINSFLCPFYNGKLTLKYAYFGNGNWNFEKFKSFNSLEMVFNRKNIKKSKLKIDLYNQLIYMMKEAIDNNIRIVDMDYSNVGFNNNILKIFDLGGKKAIDRKERNDILSNLEIIHTNLDYHELFDKKGIINLNEFFKFYFSCVNKKISV